MSYKNNRGFVLVTVLLLLGLFLALLSIYYVTTSSEIATVRYTKGTTTGFFSAEAGLNVRAETVRGIFVDFNRPAGVSPSTANPCEGGDTRSGDFVCRTATYNGRTVTSYVEEDANNPVVLTIPVGERYQNLTAQEYRYTAKANSVNLTGLDEAKLELKFKSRLVPLFQFAAFYTKDLEILPGPTMTLAGPVHTNGDLYLYSNSATLTINGQVTAAGRIYRGRKDGSVTPSCNNNAVRIPDPVTLRSLVATCPSRTLVTQSDVTPFNSMVQFSVPAVTVPAPEVFDPEPGKVYWDKADLRLVLELTTGDAIVGVEVRNVDDTINAAATTTLNACAGQISTKAVGTTLLWNFRENKNIRLLDVDLLGLMNCLYNSNWFGTGKSLSETTDGGLVFHMTVKGPSSALLPNPYGVRVRRGSRIYSSVSGAPSPRGLTIISDQAFYVLGSYNSTNKIPAAIMSDSLNVLSNNWSDANASAGKASRVATPTTINAAFVAGTDSTGGVEGVTGQGGAYNGGLENYPRLHERWSSIVFTYRGSFVSLGTPRHVNGSWSAQSYDPPNRDWNYDTSFNNAANLPPITPRFVYLRQELFVRDFTN